MINFWTSYGVNTEYIHNRIREAIDQSKNYIRVAHSHNNKSNVIENNEKPIEKINKSAPSQSSGCYVATAVYGSYDCPQVWTLRRFRDYTLSSTWYGRMFIHFYYAISPTLVKIFGSEKWFINLWKCKLDKMVKNLQAQGVESTAYEDKQWNTK